MCSRQPFGAGRKIPPVQCTEGTVLGHYRTNRQESLAEKIRQNPQTHLRGVALEFQHQTAGERAAVQYLMGFLNFCLGEGSEDMGLDFALVEHGKNLLPQQL